MGKNGGGGEPFKPNIDLQIFILTFSIPCIVLRGYFLYQLWIVFNLRQIETTNNRRMSKNDDSKFIF